MESGLEKKIKMEIDNEMETLRKENENLSEVINMWKIIINKEYNWFGVVNLKKKRIYKLIDNYFNFIDFISNFTN